LDCPGRVSRSPTRRRMPSRRGAGPRRIWPPTWCGSSPSCRARWAASTRARKGSRGGLEGDLLPLPADRRGRRRARRRGSKLGAAAVTWAAVLARRQARSVAGMFARASAPPGSRDPLGLEAPDTGCGRRSSPTCPN
jgi:hypothetical protein